MIIDNDFDSLNNFSCEVSDIIKIITYNTVLRNVYSAHQMADRYLLVIFAQEKEYGALITRQHWSLKPYGNTSQHLPALVRWKISICWSNWLG